jgi:hypothetical protein
MKQILLALLILGAGAIVFARLNLLADQSRGSANRSCAERARLTSQVAELAASATDLRAQVEAKKTRLAETPMLPAGGADAAAARSGDSSRDSQGATPADLRQRLGLGWNNSADYILVSKAALNWMYLEGIDRNGTPTPTACAVLGLTPAERGTIEAALQRAAAEHETWVKTAVQRVEPTGDVVADYRLPANTNLAQRIADEGTALLTEPLGPERARLVHKYAGTWLVRHGTLGEKSVRFTVRPRADGTQPALWYQLEFQDHSSSSGDVAPGNFPDLFRSFFPGGWRDLAQREGFALPQGVE